MINSYLDQSNRLIENLKLDLNKATQEKQITQNDFDIYKKAHQHVGELITMNENLMKENEFFKKVLAFFFRSI